MALNWKAFSIAGWSVVTLFAQHPDAPEQFITPLAGPSSGTTPRTAGAQLVSGVPAPFALPRGRGLDFANGDLGFRITVPADATSLEIRLATATADVDVDLWVRYEQDVDVASNGLPLADHLAEDLSGSETLFITRESTPPLRAGTYYIGFAVYNPVATTGTITATLGNSPNPATPPPALYPWQTDWNQYGAAMASFLRTFQFSGTGSFLTSKFAGKQVVWTGTVGGNPGPTPPEVRMTMPAIPIRVVTGATGILLTLYVYPKDSDSGSWTPQALPPGKQVRFRATLGNRDRGNQDLVFATISGQVIAWANAHNGELLGEAPRITSATDAASLRSALVPGSWFTLRGSGLASVTRSWTADDFSGNRLPTTLSGTSVTIGGRPAYLAYISPDQINGLVPALPEGAAAIETTSAGGTARLDSRVQPYAPSLFTFEPENRRYAAAVHPDGTLLAKPGLFGSGVAVRALLTGGRGVLYGTGFGRTDPAVPDGETFTGANSLAGVENLRLSIGGRAATVEFAGAISPGLYQINFVCPQLTRGDHAVEIEFAGGRTQQNLFLSVDGPEPPPPASRLVVSPASLSFTATQSGTAPAAQNLAVSFTPAAAIGWAAAATTESGGGWLRVSPASGSSAGQVSVSVTQAGLAPGTYRGSVAVTPAGGGAAQSIPVALTVQAAPSSAAISASRDSLSFDMAIGGSAPQAQQIQVTASGPPMEFEIDVSKPDAPWLQITRSSRTTPATVTFEINTRAITQGRYARHVRLRGPAGQIKTVLVVFTATFPGDGIYNTATSLTLEVTHFGANADGQDFPPVDLPVTHPGIRVPFSHQVTRYTPGPVWVDATPGGPNTPSTIRVTRSTRGLAPGVHDAMIRVYNDRSQSEIPVQFILRIAPL